MDLLENSVSSFFSCPTTVMGAVALLLVLYLISTSFVSEVALPKQPPGPRPLPLLGNLLQLDLKRPYRSLCELSKKYGSVFTVYLGTNKVVVLAGYKAVKEALVGHAEAFGERDISPIFNDINRGHGRRACLGESLAKMELFLSFTSLLQRFRFSPPPGVSEDELDLTPAVGFSLSPLPHELCAVSRQ